MPKPQPLLPIYLQVSFLDGIRTFSGMLHTRRPILRVFGIIIGCCTVAHGDIPRSVALVLGASRLLAMAKDTSGFRPIAMGEVFPQLISHSIILQHWEPFQEHLSPH